MGHTNGLTFMLLIQEIYAFLIKIYLVPTI